MAVDMVRVRNVGVEGRKALEVAAVSLTAKEMDPLRTPCRMSGRVGLMHTILLLLPQCLCCWYFVLSLFVWPVGRLKRTCLAR
jgi:hypothetical protein